MINKYVAMGLGALIALAPVVAVAQTDTTTPAASAPAADDPCRLRPGRGAVMALMLDAWRSLTVLPTWHFLRWAASLSDGVVVGLRLL